MPPFRPRLELIAQQCYESIGNKLGTVDDWPRFASECCEIISQSVGFVFAIKGG
jgi:hypothetical protein